MSVIDAAWARIVDRMRDDGLADLADLVDRLEVAEIPAVDAEVDAARHALTRAQLTRAAVTLPGEVET